jgi:hypothetical protein
MRRAKRISVELQVSVCLFDNRRQARIGDALAGRIKNFSPLGAAMTVATIMLEGRHLFYSCTDNPDIVLELVFALDGLPEKIITVLATPVWFDRDLESDKARFDVGLKFLADPKSQEIKTLSQEACKDEKRLVSLWKKLF